MEFQEWFLKWEKELYKGFADLDGEAFMRFCEDKYQEDQQKT